jgi:hypothetical protein
MLSGFDDVLMRRLQAGERFPTIQAMWESDVGQILIAFLASSTIFRGYRSGEDLGDENQSIESVLKRIATSPRQP